MADCTTLYWGVIEDYWGTDWEDLCCYTQPSQTYNDFITGITATYDSYCLKEKVFADYVTQLFSDCLSGSASSGIYVTGGTANGSNDTVVFTNNSGGTFTVTNSALLFNDAFVSGGTLDAGTGCVTFVNTSGGTFQVCGFDGFTSYWSANTDGSISTSGVTEVKISADTMVEGDVALETLSAIGGSISINSSVYQNGNFTIQNGKILRAYGDVYLGNQAVDVTTVSGDIGVSGDTNINGVISGNTNARFGGVLGVSGNTFLGDVDAATPTATDNILIVQSGGLVESITIAELTGFTSDYWIGDGTGTGIKPSGITTNVIVDGDIHGNSNLRIDQLVHFNTASTSANTYLGYQAGNPDGNSTLQQYNTAIGHQALASQTGGGDVDENVAVGYRSLYRVSTGEWNTALGTNTARYISTSDGNTAIGNKALGGAPAVGGAYNIAIGYMSAYNVKGSGNLFFGIGAGSGNNSGSATGSNNVGVGDYSVGGGGSAGVGTLTTGNYNLGFGSKSLQYITSGAHNIAIGGQAGDNITSGDYNILIGASQDPASATADYQMNIGGVIYGKDLTSSSSINAIGIGIVNPTAKLHVYGTTILTSELGVSGNTNINGVISGNTNARFGGVLGVSGKTYLGSVAAATPTSTDNILIVQSDGLVESITTTQLTGLTDGLFWTANTDGSISNSGLTGYVGIGTDTPNKPLTVVGAISATTAIYLGNPTGGTFISGETAVSGDLSLHSDDDIEYYCGDDMVFNVACKIKFTALTGATPSLQLELDNLPGVCYIENGLDNHVLAISTADTRLYFADVGSEWISGNTTDLTIGSGNDIFLTALKDVNIPVNVGLTFGDDGEKIEGDGTDITITSGADIILNPTNYAGVGITVPTNKLHIVEASEGDDPLRVQTVNEGDGYTLLIQDDGVVKKSSKLYVSENGDVGISGDTNINGLLSADTNVVIHGVLGVSGATNVHGELSAATNVYVHGVLGVSGATNVHGELSAATNVHVNGAIGISGKTSLSDSLLMATSKKLEFSTTDEHLVSDGTDLTIASGAKINLTATSDVVVPANVGITFGSGEKIEGDNTDLTITSGADIILASTANVGIGITTPKTKLDVHHDPTALATDTGGGEVVTFGSNGSGMVAGKLYYLNTSGAWILTQSNASSTHGNSQLLGIALGDSASDGVLLRGFFDVATYFSGTFNEGIPVYVDDLVGGKITATAPADANEFIRVVGYCTTTANVIYFNPDGTYITLS